MSNDKPFVVLAIYEVHMASAAIGINGAVVAAAHEERFTRIKNDVGFPVNAVRFCMKNAGITPSEIDLVGLTNEKFDPNGVANILFKRMSHYSIDDWIYENERYWRPRLVEKKEMGNYFSLMGGWDRVPEGHHYNFDGLDMNGTADQIISQFHRIRVRAVTTYVGVPETKIRFLPHWKLHHFHTFFSNPNRTEDGITAHAEGSGEAYNSAVSVYDDAHILKTIGATNRCDIGRLYQWMTLLLGMKPYHHEYKLMGLAPYASDQEIERSKVVFNSIFEINDAALTIEYKEKPLDLYFTLREKLQGHRFDGIAGGLQEVVEELLAAWIKGIAKRTERSNFGFGGGVAMNVKANGCIGRLSEVDNFFVPISPGDESNVFGVIYQLTAQWLVEQGRNPLEEIPGLENPYLGTGFEPADIAEALNDYDAPNKYLISDDVTPDMVAGLLADGLVIARCDGREEFGQRALGNRSILANPSAPGVVEKINKKIKCRDFWMPFALTILQEDQDQYIINPKSLPSAFMGMSFPVRESARSALKGGIHPADNSTRPQLLKKKQNRRYYELIKQFHQKTNISAVINTSFNLHGEPIASTPSDALHVFENSDLDGLVLGDTLIRRNQNS
jgi:carbamoyltransferase